jgi:hypothetical protein
MSFILKHSRVVYGYACILNRSQDVVTENEAVMYLY